MSAWSDSLTGWQLFGLLGLGWLVVAAVYGLIVRAVLRWEDEGQDVDS